MCVCMCMCMCATNCHPQQPSTLHHVILRTVLKLSQSLFENLCYNLFIFKWRILSPYYNIITRFLLLFQNQSDLAFVYNEKGDLKFLYINILKKKYQKNNN